jgi:hypothetical protein
MSPDDIFDSVAWLYGGPGLSENAEAAAGAIGSAKARSA